MTLADASPFPLRTCQQPPTRKVRRPMRTHLITGILSVAVLSAVLGSCGSPTDAAAPPAPATCARLDTGTANSTLLVLTDGKSQAFTKVTDLLSKDDSQLFHSPDLHLDSDPGMVVIASYSPAGVGTVQSFNLGGVGNGGRAVADARTQRACMVEAIAALPPARGGDLLRALGSSVSQTLSQSTGPIAVLATGASRLSILDFSTTGSDLSTPKARSTAIETLDNSGLVPKMSHRVKGVFFVAPDEGIPNPLQANSVSTFVHDDLCQALAVPCSSSATPKLGS